MEHNTNNPKNTALFNEEFNVAKMRLLISDDHKESFSEKFKNWLQAYTRNTREKVWVDIESYKAW